MDFFLTFRQLKGVEISHWEFKKKKNVIIYFILSETCGLIKNSTPVCVKMNKIGRPASIDSSFNFGLKQMVAEQILQIHQQVFLHQEQLMITVVVLTLDFRVFDYLTICCFEPKINQCRHTNLKMSLKLLLLDLLSHAQTSHLDYFTT